MRRAAWIGAVACIVLAPHAWAQAVPEGSQASMVDMGYRRFSQFRVDPFRNVMIPHWGFVMSLGATGENSVLNFADIGAVKYIEDNDQLAVGDYIDLLGLIPQGQGVRGVGQAEAGFYLGGPIGRHLAIGISAQARGYGSMLLEDGAVALVRDGNTTQSNFDLGSSGGSALATGEFGAHLVGRFGPLQSEDGVHVAVGFGLRSVRPAAYTQARLAPGSGRVIRTTADSIATDLSFEWLKTPLADVADATDRIKDGQGSGIVADLLLRLEWPTSGLAIEALVANVGKVTAMGVERDTASLIIATSDPRDDIPTAFDALVFEAQDTVDVEVTLPRIIRFSAGAWANRFLQIDLATTLAVDGEFDTPLTMDIGTTWRFVRHLPLRAGVILGGHQGLGFSGGLAIEARNLFLQVAGQSLGGFFEGAKGVGVRLDFGTFF